MSMTHLFVLALLLNMHLGQAAFGYNHDVGIFVRPHYSAGKTSKVRAATAVRGGQGEGGTAEKPCIPKLEASDRSEIASFKVMDVLRKANELEGLGRSILHCEVGQPESGAPAPVAAEAARALTGPPRQVMGYTDAFGLPALRAKIARHYLDTYDGVPNGRVDVGNIAVTTGSSGGFLLVFTACFDAGDTIAVASSGYPCYRNILTALDCRIASVPVNRRFKLTARELGREIARREGEGEDPLKGLILSSPSNPTGAMLDAGELRELCELCDEKGIRFISDEIYHGISYGKREATALSFSETAVVINSFSKYYSMAGWRLGWLVIPDDLVEPINRLQQNMFINAPTISQTAALRCWDDDTIEELEGHVEKYRASREYILKELASIPELDPDNIAPADGGFYVYVDLGIRNVVQSVGLGSVAMCAQLLEEEGVAFTPGIDFEDPDGPLGDRRFRISYAGSQDTVKEAMERFHRFWYRWQERVRQEMPATIGNDSP